MCKIMVNQYMYICIYICIHTLVKIPKKKDYEWQFIVDLAIRKGGFPWLCYVSLPEGIYMYRTRTIVGVYIYMYT